MSEDLFKLFDKVNKQYMKSLEGYKEPVCKHETVFEGTCEACYQPCERQQLSRSNVCALS